MKKRNVKKPHPAYQEPGTGYFKEGNPGKPIGAITQRRRFANMLYESFGNKQQEVFKRFFERPNRLHLDALALIGNLFASERGMEVGSGEMPPLVIQIEGEGGKQSVNIKAKTREDIP